MAESRIVAILPCNDLDASVAFYAQLGLMLAADWGDYKILANGEGWHLHLARAQEGWLSAERNPCAIYLYVEDVDSAAERMRGQILPPGRPEEKPWGTYEFAMTDPSGALVRVGRPLCA